MSEGRVLSVWAILTVALVALVVGLEAAKAPDEERRAPDGTVAGRVGERSP